MSNSDPQLESIVNKITESSKYRNFPFLEETLWDLVLSEYPSAKNEVKLEKAVRKKLHNIIALYLGDPNYVAAGELLSSAVNANDEMILRDVCIEVMKHHSSTRERIPILEDIYPAIFSVTGKPSIVLDLACGLHPLSIPWMNLNKGVSYYAFDIHYERVKFLNSFFASVGLNSLAQTKDILANFPNESGDVAFIFKEVHRFEQRKRGVSIKLFEHLRVPNLVVSFPIISMSRQHNLLNSYKSLFSKIIESKPWQIEELIFDREIFFIIKKF